MYLGNWIKPWPGENVVGYIIAQGHNYVTCVAAGGLHFHVRLADIRAGKCAFLTAPIVNGTEAPRPKMSLTVVNQ